MPSILREKTVRVKRSASSTTGPKGKLRKLDPLKVLDRLEDKEKEIGDEDGEGNNFFLSQIILDVYIYNIYWLAKFSVISLIAEDKKDGDSEDDGEIGNQEIDEEEADEDEEMDEGTDYANACFDNGEAYADEDNPQDENESTFY